jgi:hypothetical protein
MFVIFACFGCVVINHQKGEIAYFHVFSVKLEYL